MFIKISWYDLYAENTLETIVSDTRAAHTLVGALDNSRLVRQWRCDLAPQEYPWYQEKLWDKCVMDWRQWDYS